MALTAVLEFGDNNIRRYSCPEGDTRCDRMELFVVAPGKEDLTLFEWFANQSVLDGRVVISLGATNDNSLDSQEIVFEEAVCFALSEMYDIESSMRRLLKLSILANKICIDDVCFE